MKFSYQGPDAAVEVFGLVFPRGTPVNVEDAHAQSKLKAHPQFKSDTLTLPDKPADKKAK
jgi:hypothetical protein